MAKVEQVWQESKAKMAEAVKAGISICQGIVSDMDSRITELAKVMVQMREAVTRDGEPDYQGTSDEYRDGLSRVLEPLGPAPGPGESERPLRRHVREKAASLAWETFTKSGKVKGLSSVERNVRRIGTVRKLKAAADNVAEAVKNVAAAKSDSERGKAEKNVADRVKSLGAAIKASETKVVTFGGKREPLVKEENATLKAARTAFETLSEEGKPKVDSDTIQAAITLGTPAQAPSGNGEETTPASRVIELGSKLDLLDRSGVLVGVATSLHDALMAEKRGSKTALPKMLGKVTTQLKAAQDSITTSIERVGFLLGEEEEEEEAAQ